MLRGECLLVRSGSQLLLLLRNIECLLGQVASLARRIHAAGSLLQRKARVAHFNADALLQLFKINLRLPVLEFGAVLVGLGDAIAQRNAQLKAHLIFGRRVVERIVYRAAKVRGHVG